MLQTPMTMELLWLIIKELEDGGFRVQGTFDLGNKRFQKEFGLHNGVYKVRFSQMVLFLP